MRILLVFALISLLSAITPGLAQATEVLKLGSGQVLNINHPACTGYKLYCWGIPVDGYDIMNGVVKVNKTPQPVPSPTGVTLWKELSAGNDFELNYSQTYCMIGNNDQIYCVGTNGYMYVFGLDTHTPISTTVPLNTPTVLPAGETGWKKVASNDWNTCAISLRGKLYCWGYNEDSMWYGLGNGTSGSKSKPTPVDVPSDKKWKDVTAPAGEGGCAIAEDGDAYCWGYNSHGQLGDQTTTSPHSPVKIILPTGSTGWKQIARTTYSTCGLDNNDQVYCWGRNHRGQLGNGTTTDSKIPVKITIPSGVTSWKSLAGSHYHACAVGNNNEAYCWGDNDTGELGDDTLTSRTTPTLVKRPASVSAWESVSVGAYTSCAISSAGDAYCWGDNKTGQFGDNTTISSKVPVKVVKPSGVGRVRAIYPSTQSTFDHVAISPGMLLGTTCALYE